MKMKPVVKNSWNVAKVETKASSEMGPMIGIGNQFCCAC